MRSNYGIRTAYTLGAAMVAAAIIYFFASGWEALTRSAQITLSILLTALFYGAAYALSFRARTAWLSKVAAVTGCVAFGVSVLLLGRIYNSHADSYGLFLLWSIPALGFAIFTRYWPFKLLAYILLHITAYTYASTAPWLHKMDDWHGLLLVSAVIALVNLLVYLWLQVRGEEKLVRTLSFLMVWFQLLFMTNSLMFDNAGIGLNLLFGPWAILCIRYALRHRSEGKRLLAIAGIYIALFAILKYIELTFHYWDLTFFGFGLVFVAALLAASTWFIRFLNRLDVSAAPDDIQRRPEGAEQPVNPQETVASDTNDGSAPHTTGQPKARRVPLFDIQHILWSVVSAVGVLIGYSSLVGITMIVAADSASHVLAIISFGLIVAAILTKNHLPAPVRFTVSLIAALTGTVIISGTSSLPYACLYLALTVFAWYRTEGRVSPALFYGLANVYAYQLGELLLPEPFNRGWNLLALLLAFNLAVLAAAHLGRRVGEERRTHLKRIAYVTVLVLSLTLTWDESGNAYRYAAASIIFFLILTALLIRLAGQEGKRFYFRWGVSAWSVFVVFKYYETAWKLLHKSFSLACAGAVLILLAAWLDRRSSHPVDPAETTFMRTARKSVAALLVLQALLLAVSVYTNETALANGTTITLKLAPLDPRSMMQGDYVQLRYDISTLPGTEVNYDKEGNSLEGEKVRVVLEPGDQGIYRISRIYEKGEELKAGEVVLNGTRGYDSNVTYGIEHYFIPEGTGAEVERNAKYAQVIVSRTGNGMIVKLLNAPASP